MARWQRISTGPPQWQERSDAVVRHIKEGDKVLDVGAGARGLRDALPANCTYTSLDLVPGADMRADIETCSPLLFAVDSFDVAVFAGVVEYLHAPVLAIGKCCLWARRVLVTYDAEADSVLDTTRRTEERLLGLNGCMVDLANGMRSERVGEWKSHAIYEVRRL